MRHPRRHIRAFLDAELPQHKRSAVESHLERCAPCRSLVEEERRLRIRLRTMSIPLPGEDLAQRIVASGSSLPAAAETKRPRTRARYALAFGSVLTLVSGFVLAGAYVLGTLADEPLSAPQQAHLLAGWNQVTENQSGELSQEQLEKLREAGWSCPELAELGFTLEGATATHVAGQPAVALVLARNGEEITLYEQRPGEGDTSLSVLHAVSERPVTEEGFTQQTGNAATSPMIWQDPEKPGQAVLSTGNVTYTLASSASEEMVASAVSELSLTESARLLVPSKDRDSGPIETVMRGFSLLAGAGGSL